MVGTLLWPNSKGPLIPMDWSEYKRGVPEGEEIILGGIWGTFCGKVIRVIKAGRNGEWTLYKNEKEFLLKVN